MYRLWISMLLHCLVRHFLLHVSGLLRPPCFSPKQCYIGSEFGAADALPHRIGPSKLLGMYFQKRFETVTLSRHFVLR